MNLNRFVGLIVIAILFVSATYRGIDAQEIPLGKIEKVTGPVNVLRSDGRQVRGAEGLFLFPGDQITTGKRGKVWFSLQKGRQFRLGEDAQMSLDELSGPEMEDDQPVLRLVLGYLWSKIQRIRQKPGMMEVHTPTAVLGVRGTEFDSVVSLDGTSVITVDEGSVELDAEDKKLILTENKMAQVEIAEKPTPPEPAIPKEKRDWPAWRKMRMKKFSHRLPQLVPRLCATYQRAENRFTRFTTKVQVASHRVTAAIEEVHKARRDRDRQRFAQSVKQLKSQMPQFKRMVANFRRALNRAYVKGIISYRIEQFVIQHREHFSDQEIATIESNLAVIAQKRMQIKHRARQTIARIRRTFKKLKELRIELTGVRKVQTL
jgi:hypothetical protein